MEVRGLGLLEEAEEEAASEPCSQDLDLLPARHPPPRGWCRQAAIGTGRTRREFHVGGLWLRTCHRDGKPLVPAI